MYSCMCKNIFASFGNVQDLICSWKKLLTKRTCLWCLLMGLAHGLQSQTGMQRKDEKGVSTGGKHYCMRCKWVLLLILDQSQAAAEAFCIHWVLAGIWTSAPLRLPPESIRLIGGCHLCIILWLFAGICRVSPQLINHGLLMRNWHWILIEIKTD